MNPIYQIRGEDCIEFEFIFSNSFASLIMIRVYHFGRELYTILEKILS